MFCACVTYISSLTSELSLSLEQHFHKTEAYKQKRELATRAGYNNINITLQYSSTFFYPAIPPQSAYYSIFSHTSSTMSPYPQSIRHTEENQIATSPAGPPEAFSSSFLFLPSIGLQEPSSFPLSCSLPLFSFVCIVNLHWYNSAHKSFKACETVLKGKKKKKKEMTLWEDKVCNITTSGRTTLGVLPFSLCKATRRYLERGRDRLDFRVSLLPSTSFGQLACPKP